MPSSIVTDEEERTISNHRIQRFLNQRDKTSSMDIDKKNAACHQSYHYEAVPGHTLRGIQEFRMEEA